MLLLTVSTTTRLNINHFAFSSSMIKKSKLREAIDPCVRIFQFFCFADVQLEMRSSARKKFTAFWFLIKYFALTGVLVYLFYESLSGRINRLQISSNRRFTIVVVIFFIGTMIKGFTSLFQSLMISSKSLKFMKRIEDVDELLVNALKLKINYNELRWTLLRNIILSILFYFGCSFGAIVSATKLNPHIWGLVLHFYFPILLSQIFIQRYIFMVQLLKFYLETIACFLEKSINYQPLLVRKDESNNWKWNMRANHFKVKVLQKAYGGLWEASNLINDCFDFSLIVFFIVSFLSLLYQGYSLCIDITKNEANHLRQFLSILMTLFGIFTVHTACQQCLNSVIF